MKLKLHASPGACSLASHIVLEWIGAPYDIAYYSGAERKEPAFKKLNPAGAVPVLEIDDWVLTQNVAILNFLADSFPESKLNGDGSTRSRAQINYALGIATSDIHPTFKPLFGTTSYLGNEAAIDMTKANARTKVHNLLAIMDAQLADQDWLTGARSVADPLLYVMTRWTKNVGLKIDDLPNLTRFMKSMEQDAGVQKALQDEGLQKFF